MCILYEYSGEGVRRGSEMWLLYFSDGCRGREKIVEEVDRNIWKGGSGKKDGNNRVWILTRDGGFDFEQIKIVGPDRVRTGRKGSDALREL